MMGSEANVCSNLIKKIREMSEAATPLFPGMDGERVLPRAVERPV